MVFIQDLYYRACMWIFQNGLNTGVANISRVQIRGSSPYILLRSADTHLTSFGRNLRHGGHHPAEKYSCKTRRDKVGFLWIAN